MTEHNDMAYVRHMLDCIERIQKYTVDMNADSFAVAYQTQDAVMRNIEIIGEAAKHVSTEFQKMRPYVPWSDMAKTRDKLIHHYFQIDITAVWKVVQDDLPEIKKHLQEMT